tara:strand:- start:98 stop:553 length:456 start_codon:yes stop_codon:yes gene_type:complete
MISKEEWMSKALNQAIKGYDNNEVPIGSIIVKDDKIIGKGYNQTECLNDSTAHAELLAITSASNTISDWRLNDCSIYVTKEPCLMCFGAIVNSRIKNLFYGFIDKEKGFRKNINIDYLFLKKHLVLIESGLLENKCKNLVQDFFIQKRKKS